MVAETDRLENARSQAKAQIESIVAMVQRLGHSRDCDGDDCELSDADILAGLNLSGKTADDDDREAYHDEEAAQTMIWEDALSVEFRSDWHTPGEEAEDSEYRICLCTGGPAVQIVGELGAFGPDSARLQCQDWFTPWVDVGTTTEEDAALLDYAQQLVTR